MPISIITASYDHRVVFWELGGSARRTLPFADSQVNCLALSPDKSKLAVGGHGCIRLYDASPTAGPQSGNAIGLADSSMINGNVTSMHFVDIATVKGSKAGEEDAVANGGKVARGRNISNEYTLLVTSEDGSIKVFALKANNTNASAQNNSHQQHQNQMTFSLRHEVLTKVPITAATVFPNQQLLLTGTQLGRMSVWHMAAIFNLPDALLTANVGNDVVDESSQLNSATSNTGLVAAKATVKPIQELALEADPTSVRSIAVAPVGNFISVATNIGRLHFFAFCRGDMAMRSDAARQSAPLRPVRPIRNSNPHFNQNLNPFVLEEFTFTVAHEKYILKTAIAPNGRYVVTASADYTVGVFGVPDYLASGQFLQFSDIYSHATVSTPTGARGCGPSPITSSVAHGGTEGAAPAAVEGAAGATEAATSNAPSSFAPAVGAAGNDLVEHLLPFQGGVAAGIEDPRLRFPLRRTFLGHQRWVWDCCVSPCSCYILSVSSDHTGRLWKVEGDLSSASPAPLTAERLAADLVSPPIVPPPNAVNNSIGVYSFHNKAVNCCLLDIEP